MQRNIINIKDLDKAAVLAGLYNNSKVQGMGFFGQKSLGNKAGKAMTVEDAKKEIEDLQTNGRKLYFDYLHGKVMKIDLSGDELNPGMYDRDNGEGAAKAAIEQVRNSADRLFQVGPILEGMISQEKKIDETNEALKQKPEEVLSYCNNSLRIFAIPQAPSLLGRESELTDKELKKVNVDISFNGKISSFPQLKSGEKLVCAYNQWGMTGMAKMFECNSIENMQELYTSYSRGGAITIDWYAMTDKKLENTAHKNNSNTTNESDNFGGLKPGFLSGSRL